MVRVVDNEHTWRTQDVAVTEKPAHVCVLCAEYVLHAGLLHAVNRYTNHNSHVNTHVVETTLYKIHLCTHGSVLMCF